MQLAQQASMYRMQKTLGKSAQIMAMMNQLVKLPQLNQVMMAMSREMEKVMIGNIQIVQSFADL
jgi:charged multivesicular body protein 3